MTTNPPPDARNARIYVATANVAVMDILSGREQWGAAISFGQRVSGASTANWSLGQARDTHYASVRG